MFVRVKHSLCAVALGLALLALVRLALTSAASSEVNAVRSTSSVHFVNDAGTVITEGVRVLCYATDSIGAPIADLVVEIDATGQANLPRGCNYVAALRLRHEQPSGKPDHGPAYRVYATSWASGTTTPLTTTGAITIRDDWPLVLFNVVAGLAWEPSPTSTYIADLRQGLRAASGYLYDVTDGQMAFGPMTIHTNGHDWESADLRFFPANDYRPGSYVGGIVSDRIGYVSNRSASTTYAPAASYFGRYWDGDNASDPVTGNWHNKDAFRTIVHEWAHYALFLYDEYQQADAQPIYCTCRDLDVVGPNYDLGVCRGVTETLAASIMAYQYTASEFWHIDAHGTLTECTSTRQWEVHGSSDWDTLNRWHEIQQLPITFPPVVPPPTLDPGPNDLGITGDLFGRSPGYTLYLPMILRPGPAGPTPKEPTEEVTINVSLDVSTAVTETLPTQVYILEGMESGAPTRILHQGKVLADPDPATRLLGNITLLGIEPEDRVRVFVDRYTTLTSSGGRFVYPSATVTDSVLENNFNAVATTTTWDYSLVIMPNVINGQLAELTVQLTATVSGDVTAQLCVPDAEIGCAPDWHQIMALVPGSSGRWTATFTPLPGRAEMPPYAIIRVEAEGTGELIRWFQVTTIGPAHIRADAPLSDWHVMIDAATPPTGMLDVVNRLAESSACSKVVVMPAANLRALTTLLPAKIAPGFRGIIGQPFDIRCSRGPGEELPLFNLTMFYDQETIERLRSAGLNIQEGHLSILHFDGNQWSIDSTNPRLRNTELNWRSAVGLTEDGIYAIGWIVSN
jgi:hypothetical protein